MAVEPISTALQSAMLAVLSTNKNDCIGFTPTLPGLAGHLKFLDQQSVLAALLLPTAPVFVPPFQNWFTCYFYCSAYFLVR
jgi:hypothetical protein